MEMMLGFELARNYRVKKLNVVTDLDALKDELNKCNLKGTTTFAISVWSDIAASIAQLNAASYEPSHSYIDSVEDDGPNVVVAFRAKIAPDLDADESTQHIMAASQLYSTTSSSFEEAQLAVALADDPTTPAAPDTPPITDSTSASTERSATDEVPADTPTAVPTEDMAPVTASEAPSPGPAEEPSEPLTSAPTEGTIPEAATEPPSTGPDVLPPETPIELTVAPSELEAPSVAPSESLLEPTFSPTVVPSAEPALGDDEEVIPGDDEYISDEPQYTSSPSESHHLHHVPTESPSHTHHVTLRPTSQRYVHPTHAPTKKNCKCKNQTGCLSKHSSPCCDGLVCKDFRWFSQCVEEDVPHHHQVMNGEYIKLDSDYYSFISASLRMSTVASPTRRLVLAGEWVAVIPRLYALH